MPYMGPPNCTSSKTNHLTTTYRWHLESLATIIADAQHGVERLPFRRLRIAWLASVQLFARSAYRFVRSSLRAETEALRGAGRLDEVAEQQSLFDMVTAIARTNDAALDRSIRRYTGRGEWAEEVLLRWGSGRSIGTEGDCLHELIAMTLASFVARRNFRVDLARVALMLALHPVTVSEETQQAILQTRHPLEVFVERTLS